MKRIRYYLLFIVYVFRLPKDGLMKEKWLKVIRTQRREDDWMPSTYSTVCSEHFLTSDVYLTKKNIRRLKRTAVPVIKVNKYNFIIF